ncbi:type II secretion system F family protein [Nocardioides jishulii]|uniref:Type II secretion system protein n=1 Tax=Nocardioides jishulii TaxID=2575440 RepID=A0A4U2YXB0_9ACTN|nr:type II secretion system F family protein [Nocardioides jishulii]QCX28296.1 type II secretion system protein [Nocardioides jishulii]TKI64811.1 type II secretion system protein [Nocardioides jishulii]
MTTSPTLLMVVLLGAVVGVGLLLLVQSMSPAPVQRSVKGGGPSLTERLAALGRRLPLGIGAGVLILVLTRWVVAAVAVAALVVFWNKLFGSSRTERAGLARLEGLATWTESLRDTVAGAIGLEQAIPATAHAAADSIRPQLLALSDRLRVRVPLPEALQRFADDMDDAGADLIIAALILNSRLRGPGLRQVLTSLAHAAREELEMRQRVNAGRRATQRSVQIVVGVTVAFVLGLRLLNPSYVEPYGTPFGQVMLVVILFFFGAGIFWLRRLSQFEAPERFLRTLESRRAA